MRDRLPLVRIPICYVNLSAVRKTVVLLASGFCFDSSASVLNSCHVLMFLKKIIIARDTLNEVQLFLNAFVLIKNVSFYNLGQINRRREQNID